MRAIPIVLAGCCLSALVLLGRSPSADSPPMPPQVADQAPVPASSALPTTPELTRTDVEELPLRIVDRLTGAELGVSVELRATEDAPALSLATAELCNLSLFQADVSVGYPLADGTRHEVRLADCRVPAEGAWILSLPYACRIVVEYPDEDLSVQGEIYLCRPPPARPPAAVEATASRGPFELEGVDMSAEGALHWALRSNRAEILLESALGLPTEVAARGPAAMALHLEDGRSGYATLQLEPGEVVHVRPEWRSRPRLEGVLLGWDGQPVPDARVRLAVSMDLADYDFRPGDSHALAVLRSEGVLHHSLIRRLKTDAEGRFSVIAPRGREYALYSHALGGHAMWTTLREPSAHGDHTDLVLQLAAPGAEGAVEFEVRRPDGAPFVGGRVEISVVNDVPFFRQWPDDLLLDEHGRTRMLGIETGAEICVLVRHEELVRGVFASRYMIVPPSRMLTVDLPPDCLGDVLVGGQ